MLLSFAFAILTGLSLGLLGGGGSILTVPIFVYVLGFAAKPAIAMSLPVVGVTSLVGAVGHWRAGNVHLRTALLFGFIAMAGAYPGARLAAFVPGSVQLTILAIVMLGAAASMLRQTPDGTTSIPANAESSAAIRSSLPIGKILVVGLAVGALTGVVGIGGGFLIVPALVILGRVPMKQAVGTSLVVIVMNSAAGFLGYLEQVAMPWRFLAGFTAMSIGGVLAGTHLLRFVSAQALRRGFAMFLLATGGFMLYQNRAAVTGAPTPPVSPTRVSIPR